MNSKTQKNPIAGALSKAFVKETAYRLEIVITSFDNSDV